MGSKADVGKMFTSINKTFKTMGKAMSQVSEEIGAFGDEDSIGAQSHALVEKKSCYAFANSTAIMRECLLLDNQSLVHVFCNREYADNIRAAEREYHFRVMVEPCPFQISPILMDLRKRYGIQLMP
jgi:hypothetical protein